MFSRRLSQAEEFAATFNCEVCENIQDLDEDADLILICVPDDQVKSVAESVQNSSAIIAHTSGNTSISALEGARRFGVFYPLQTFTKHRKVDMTEVPLCLEASDPAVMKTLVALAGKVTEKVVEINSRQRKFLHLAAVLVNNFSNFMYQMAEDTLKAGNWISNCLSHSSWKQQQKIDQLDPFLAQTGPARRGDKETMARHIELLDGEPEIQAVYQIISEQILKKYHE